MSPYLPPTAHAALQLEGLIDVNKTLSVSPSKYPVDLARRVRRNPVRNFIIQLRYQTHEGVGILTYRAHQAKNTVSNNHMGWQNSAYYGTEAFPFDSNAVLPKWEPYQFHLAVWFAIYSHQNTLRFLIEYSCCSLETSRDSKSVLIGTMRF